MFNNLRDAVRKYFAPQQPLPPGTHHYQAPVDASHPYRLHLRIDPGGGGLLIINARTVLHLNPTAAEYAYYLVKGLAPDDVAKKVHSRYRVSHEQALKDYSDLSGRIQTLIHTPDLDPVTFLDFERRDPYTADLSAPLRLDCAITYRLPDDENPSSAPTDRVKSELSTAEWKTILSKAWEVGIPQIVFTGGEPTLREDLPELIAHGEQLGQVTGLLTGGLRLTDPDYLHKLLQSGLDHILIVLEPELEEAWLALKHLLEEDIFTTIHVTVTPENAGQISVYLDRLAAMGAQTLSLSASDPALNDALQQARQEVAHRLLTLVWDLPVPYSDLHPVRLDEIEHTPKGAGYAWLYVEPDGDVLPSQGENRVLGNLLRDPWSVIWEARGEPQG